MLRRIGLWTIVCLGGTLISATLLAQESLSQISADLFKISGDRSQKASFDLARRPSGPVFLYLKLKSTGPAGSVQSLEVRLNEKTLYRGDPDLSQYFWRVKRFPVSSKVLRSGLNTLAVLSSSDLKAGTARSPFEIAAAFLADWHFVPPLDLKTDFEIEIPSKSEAFPARLPKDRGRPAFQLRGTKGWAWTPDQYLAEIPYLIKVRMNFLMNCYTSMFSSLDPFINRWWEPLPEVQKSAFEKVVRACQEKGISFCFSMHPQLFSERPMNPEGAEDFECLWQHYAWMQSLGVGWFNICFDDISVEGQDRSALGETHAKLVNLMLRRLREKDPAARFIFCPTYYAGCGDTPESRPYLEALARILDPDVFLFWTGDGVVTPRITRSCAETYRNITRHRLVIWDNYPVNDRNLTLHLGPVMGRDADLGEVVYGYMSNPLSPQNEINRIPLFTCADYAFNPFAYDPLRSVGQAIRHLAETDGQCRALKNLVELYPGMLLHGETRTSFNPVLERFHALLDDPDGRALAPGFVRRVEEVYRQIVDAFPDRYQRTKETISLHLSQMKRELTAGLTAF